jgi:hypothetical protein
LNAAPSSSLSAYSKNGTNNCPWSGCAFMVTRA